MDDRESVLLSMTGFGEARYQGDRLSLAIEVRAVNNRYLKISVRGSEPYPMLEPELERTVRKFVRRGTITIHVRVDRTQSAGEYRINLPAFEAYWEQIQSAARKVGADVSKQDVLAAVLALPGVAPEPGNAGGRPSDEEFGTVEKTLEEALQKLQAMRRLEGGAMAEELLAQHDEISRNVGEIRAIMPRAIENYRVRMHERISSALVEHKISLRPDDLIREVAVFADRSDIAEEVTRLQSHLEQFRNVVKLESDGPGRKLEFVVQEMGREANTIGSKAGDVAISRHVVDIKAALEKIRELVQNIE